MAEPASTTAASAALTGITVLSLFPGLDAPALLGAFAGASVFVMSRQDLPPLRKVVLMALSIVAGIALGPSITSAIDVALPERVVVHEAVGATVAAALGVQGLQWLIQRFQRPDEALRDILGRGGRG